MEKQLRVFIPLLLFFPAFAGSARAQETTSAEYETVKKNVEQSIGWTIEKDFDMMFRMWVDNLFIFWVYSNNEVIGLDQYKAFAKQWMDPDFHGARFAFKDLRIVFSRSGDVA